jgi:hypothetical protein
MQLDLFKAEVVVFPIARSAQVAKMVRFLTIVHGDRAAGYHLKVCKKLAARLRNCGASEAIIRAELNAFTAAVQSDLARSALTASAMEGVA